MSNKYRRGLKCSYCGKLRYFWDSEIAMMNSTYGRREQCQNCGHTHWDECPHSKRKKELKVIDQITERRGEDMPKSGKIRGIKHHNRNL